jgi:hypothetical protein
VHAGACWRLSGRVLKRESVCFAARGSNSKVRIRLKNSWMINSKWVRIVVNFHSILFSDACGNTLHLNSPKSGRENVCKNNRFARVWNGVERFQKPITRANKMTRRTQASLLMNQFHHSSITAMLEAASTHALYACIVIMHARAHWSSIACARATIFCLGATYMHRSLLLQWIMPVAAMCMFQHRMWMCSTHATYVMFVYYMSRFLS